MKPFGDESLSVAGIASKYHLLYPPSINTVNILTICLKKKGIRAQICAILFQNYCFFI